MFITLNQVLQGNTAEIQVESSSIRMMQPIMVSIGGVDRPQRRQNGAKTRLFLDARGVPSIEVLESQESIRAKLAGLPTDDFVAMDEPPMSVGISHEERQVLFPDLVPIENDSKCECRSGFVVCSSCETAAQAWKNCARL
jgi:hypothetical protein